MQDTKIYRQRISRFIERIKQLRFELPVPLEVSFINDPEKPIPYDLVEQRTFRKIKPGEIWGKDWASAWFRLEGEIPRSHLSKKKGILFDIEGEACVFKKGYPYQGLTSKIDWMLQSAKNLIPLIDSAKGRINILVEAAANGLFGARKQEYKLRQADLVLIREDIIKLHYDLVVLNSLLEGLPAESTRWKRILWGLNEVVNNWQDARGLSYCLEITASLLAVPALQNSIQAYSIGHAHLDLAWLWPVRETKRKGGRTFATALRLLEKYPEYKFGASQPQLYQWIKEDYPDLFKEIKTAVGKGRWECQGAMWVEADTNLPSGESLVRQCLYGKKFFKSEFGIDIDHLWLPDVFGYSAALPQILRKAGIDFFMTQKISWNETNKFPHHTFIWEGIDGSRILTHFLPTNDYNLSNLPHQLMESEKRFTQGDVSDSFLNLYGIGDGGGGPSEDHIELGLRQQDLSGVPRFKFAFAADFFQRMAAIETEKLPVWNGELYLELHRGTYTTQALMKKYNRQLETKLHDLEFLFTLVKEYPFAEMEQIWKDTLLHQFHDILPGSSIGKVYQDAYELSRINLEKVETLRMFVLKELFGVSNKNGHDFVIINPQGWDRNEIIALKVQSGFYEDQDGRILRSVNDSLDYPVNVPAYGFTTVSLKKTDQIQIVDKDLIAETDRLENDLLKLTIDDEGCITSLYDKNLEREVLKGKANQLLLWEDLPNNWGAWDINHFYRETTPLKAERISAEVVNISPNSASMQQVLNIGRSQVTQKITIFKDSYLVRIDNRVSWKEKHRMLRVRGEFDLRTTSSSSEIQFGLIKRPTHANTSWDRARFEVCAQRFVDLSQPDYGVALINDCKYGHFLQGSIIDLNLLRSPADVDPDADIHDDHSFTYAYYPHPDCLENSDVLQQAHSLNDPLIIYPVKKVPDQRVGSYYRISEGSVIIDTVKPAENGEGVILRLYETMGKNYQVTLSSSKSWGELVETDLLENQGKTISVKSAKCVLIFSPFQIRSFILSG